MGPEYKLDDFISACADVNRVWVRDKAQKDAQKDFKLTTKIELLHFIHHGGLEDPRHYNTKPWEQNPDKSTEIMIDAYCFFSGLKYGYIAFRFNAKIDKWYIKSFKFNRDPDPRNLPFAGLSGLILCKKLED
ncbi:MAG: hypothetical protein RBQ88_12725 [Desulfobulbus oligotrophicus]|nr:hypothetical protein [Desulfobulbus oligotrophicus]